MTARKQEQNNGQKGETVMKRVSLVLPDDVIKKVKSLAALEGISASQYITDVLQEKLSKE